DAQEGRRGGRDDDDDDFFEKCKRKYKRNWKKYCKKRGDWRRDYYEKCKRKYKRDWKKKCKRWEDQVPGLDIEAFDWAAEQSTRAALGDIASDCQTSCQQSCSGVCEAGNARACELDCHSNASQLCAPQKASSCAEQCQRSAVLLCDGQYLQVDDVDACVAALEQRGIAVEGPGSIDGEIVTDVLQGASCTIEEP